MDDTPDKVRCIDKVWRGLMMLSLLPRDLFTVITTYLNWKVINTLATTCTDIYELCEGVWHLKLEQRLGYHVPNASKLTYKKYIRAGLPCIVDRDKRPVVANEKLQQRRDIVKVCADYFNVAILTVEGECFVFDDEGHVYTTTGVRDFMLCSAGIYGVVVGLLRRDTVDVVILHECKEITSMTYTGGREDLVRLTLDHVCTTYRSKALTRLSSDVAHWCGKIALLHSDGRLIYDSEILDESVISLWANIGDGPFLCYVREP